MNLLILKGFNNYSNRIVVKYDTLKEYRDRSEAYLTFNNINFNPNDGIITEQVLGSETQKESINTPLKWEFNGDPDYIVCYETSGVTTTIRSRWFIMECQRTRLGQYKLVLKRDTLADHIEDVTDATCFIEKGIVLDKDDSAIYNKEDVTTNQIKTDEFLLKDETQCGWVVGYVAKERVDSDGTIQSTTFIEQTIPGPEADDSACDEIFADMSAFYTAHPECNGTWASLNTWNLTVNLDVQYERLFSTYWSGLTVTCYNNGEVSYKDSAYQNKAYLHGSGSGNYIWKAWLWDARKRLTNSLVSGWKADAFKSSILTQIENKEGITFTDQSTLQTFFNYVKKNPTIKIGSSYYKVYDKFGGEGDKATVKDSSRITIGSAAYDLINNALNREPAGAIGHDTITGTPGPETYSLEWSYNKHECGLREIFAECKAKVPATVPVLKDAPYHMFAIPYSDDLALYSGSTLHCVTNKSVAMNAAQALATKAGAGAVYDVQLLPYCPIRDIIKTEKVTNHYEEVAMDGILAVTGFTLNMKVKPNSQYLIRKDIELDQAQHAVYGIKSNSIIYCKIGDTTDGLENSTTVISCYGITVSRSDMYDPDSPVVIELLDANNNVIQTFDYDTYANGNTLIGVYATDSCLYASGTLPVTWRDLTMFSPKTWNMLSSYIFYEDYYMTKIDISNVTYSDIVVMVGGQESTIVSTIFWATNSQFSFNKYMDNYFLLQSDGSYKQDKITDLINEHVKQGKDIADIKVRNQVETMRLASPNYSNFFDINVQRNNGVEYINVDCTYKPFAPYLHLNPNFKGLYGADYNDVRGLICGGDYSIASITDAWATYQLQNKNYQSVFDRNIQQLEAQQDIQKTSDIANAIAGVGIGAASGAVTGAKVGGVYGAAAGAIVGAGMSALGGVADVNNNQRLREIQISTSKDIYKYQLENIKALPLGLSKTSYLTNNNKLFPFLEFYTCTPIEEQAVRDKLTYNGMTINRIGKISSFQTSDNLPYIKAQLIRIDTLADAHQVKDIADELALGVYLPAPTPEE